MLKLHWLCLVLFVGCVTPANAQAAVAAANKVSPEPSARSFTDAADAGLMKLDVVVTDSSGRPVPGLQLRDFTVLDNGSPSKILAFQASDGTVAKPESPVEVILLIDELHMPMELVRRQQTAVDAFLRENGGHLAEPVSLFMLTDSGLWLVAEASKDGNALASRLGHEGKPGLVRRFNGGLRGEMLASQSRTDTDSMLSLQALGQIGTAERRRPGRKLLLWIGPGWGIGSGAYSENTGPRNDTYYAARWFSTLLREARIALYSFSVGETEPSQLYMAYLHGVDSTHKASSMHFYRKVLAVESGGRVLDRSFDLVSQIESCVREASAYYTLSLNPSFADHPDEYHELQVQIDKPDLTARTTTGYYDQPFYIDQPEPGTRQVTADQLGQVLAAGHGDGARQLSVLQLTERLNASKLASWTGSMHRKNAQQELTALADASAFLPPPATEIPGDAPPDKTEQLRMISLATDYLKKTMPALPNFFATRTTVRYEENAQFDAVNRKVEYQPLHMADSYKETVLYRNGSEVADAAKRKRAKAKEAGLVTYGTFGPVLGLVHDALAAPSSLTFRRWEVSPAGRRAVFSYTVGAEKSLYQIWGCCLLDGDGTGAFGRMIGYRGEITIDPVSGAIFRLQAEGDLKNFTPVSRSDITITYGPAEIGGKTYICPQRSVSIMRGRSVATLMEWDEGFKTYGPYVTVLNEMTYGDYHMFRGESRVMPGFNADVNAGPSQAGPAHP
jgi:VWFA-related protein